MTDIERIRTHADHMRKLRVRAEKDTQNLLMYRALYETPTIGIVAATICFKDGQRQFVQLQCPMTLHGPFSTQQLSGVTMTWEEVAIFFHLAGVEPEAVTWSHQPWHEGTIVPVYGDETLRKLFQNGAR